MTQTSYANGFATLLLATAFVACGSGEELGHAQNNAMQERGIQELVASCVNGSVMVDAEAEGDPEGIRLAYEEVTACIAAANDAQVPLIEQSLSSNSSVKGKAQATFAAYHSSINLRCSDLISLAGTAAAKANTCRRDLELQLSSAIEVFFEGIGAQPDVAGYAARYPGCYATYEKAIASSRLASDGISAETQFATCILADAETALVAEGAANADVNLEAEATVCKVLVETSDGGGSARSSDLASCYLSVAGATSASISAELEAGEALGSQGETDASL